MFEELDLYFVIDMLALHCSVKPIQQGPTLTKQI